MIQGPGCAFKTLHFLRNLRMGPKSSSVSSLKAFLVYCNLILKLIGQIRKLRRKWSVVNMAPESRTHKWLLYLHCLYFFIFSSKTDNTVTTDVHGCQGVNVIKPFFFFPSDAAENKLGCLATPSWWGTVGCSSRVVFCLACKRSLGFTL